MDRLEPRILTLVRRHSDIEAEADANGAAAIPPALGLQILREAGLFLAPFPLIYGGDGLGTEADAAIATERVFRNLGSANLSLARLFEAHVNVIKLVVQYGSAHQITKLMQCVSSGSVLGLWVTDFANPLRVVSTTREGSVISGCKAPASGIGVVRHALMTLILADGATRMVLVRVDDASSFRAGPGSLSGMAGTANGGFEIDVLRVTEHDFIGNAEDYLREPVFSSGAWRSSAAALGAIERLMELFFTQLKARGRGSNPHQLLRVGKILIATETARWWVRKAALAAEGTDLVAADIVATVGLARTAVEEAGLIVIQAVQRGLGLSAFVTSNPIERIIRDLSTYLRQPAPDDVLTEAAAHCLAHDHMWSARS